MKASTKILAVVAALGAAWLAAGAAWAQDAAKVIDDRQALMKQQGKDFGAVKAYIEGKGELAAAQAAAADLTQTVGKIPGLFPPKSGMAEFPGKSYAKPEIWAQADKFAAAQKNAAAKAAALDAAAKGGDKAKIEAAFGEMGKEGCGGCHTPFREKKS